MIVSLSDVAPYIKLYIFIEQKMCFILIRLDQNL